MSFRNKKKKLKADPSTADQRQEQRNKEVNSKRDIIDRSKVPDGIDVYDVFEGAHEIDIIPWFAGNSHPLMKKDEIAYSVDVFVHRGVGPNLDSFVCMQKTFKKRCFICEWMGKMYKEFGKLPIEDYQKVKPTRRVYYLVWGHTKDEEEKGLQILDMPWFFLQKKIDKLKTKKKGGGTIIYYDEGAGLEGGRTITFEKEIISKSEHQYDGYTLEVREKAVPDKILDQGFSLDEALFLNPDYKEVEAAFIGSAIYETYSKEIASTGADDEDKYAGTGDDVPDFKEEPEDGVDEDEVENEVEEEAEEETEAEAEAEAEEGDALDEMDRTTLKEFIKEESLEIKVLKSMSDDDLRNAIRELVEVEEEDDEEVPDSDEEETEDEAEESEEVEEEEEEAPPAKKKAAKGAKESKDKCKKGHKFGHDLDEFPKDCKDCPQWDDCADYSDTL